MKKILFLCLHLCTAQLFCEQENRTLYKAARPNIQGNAPIVGSKPESKLDFAKIFSSLRILKEQHEKICDKLEELNEEIIENINTTSLNFEITCSKILDSIQSLSIHNESVLEQFEVTCSKLINLEESLEEHIITVSLNNALTVSKIEDVALTISLQNEFIQDQLDLTCSTILQLDENLNDLKLTVSISNEITCSAIQEVAITLSMHNIFVIQQFENTCSKLATVTCSFEDLASSVSLNTELTCSKIEDILFTLSIHEDFVDEQFEKTCTKILDIEQNLFDIEQTLSINDAITCTKILDILQTLSDHNIFVEEQFEQTCSKLNIVQETLDNGFNETATKIDDAEQILCEKILNINIQASQDTSCDILITQSMIDSGYVTPLANRVYCLAESVTFTTDYAILINKNNVVLNLQGHTVEGTNTGSSAIKIQNALNATVKNGIINNPVGAPNNGSLGLFIETSTFVKINDILINETYASGVKVESSKKVYLDRICILNANVANNTLPTADQAAFSIINSENIHCTECTAYQSGNAGFRFINTQKNLTQECISQQALLGFDIQSSRQLTFDKCIAQQCTNEGFNVNSSQKIEYYNCCAEKENVNFSDIGNFHFNESQSLLLKKCTSKFSGNVSATRGILITTCTTVAIHNCSISSAAGIELTNDEYIDIYECNIDNASTGIIVIGVTALSVEECSIITNSDINTFGFLIAGNPSTNILFKNNSVTNAFVGLNITTLTFLPPTSGIACINNSFLGGVNSGIGIVIDDPAVKALVYKNNIQRFDTGILNEVVDVVPLAAVYYANYATNNTTNYAGGIGSSPPPTAAGNCYWFNES